MTFVIAVSGLQYLNLKLFSKNEKMKNKFFPYFSTPRGVQDAIGQL